jgi:AcrR family transcriptional regulator
MMAVAEESFAERGFQATSMDEIADRVGVSKPMIYEYFGSKEGLLVACIRQVRAELLLTCTEAIAGATGAEDAMRRGFEAFLHFTDTHRRAWELMLRNEAVIAGEEALAEIEAARQEQIAMNAAVFALYRPEADPVELEAAAEMVVGACERLSIWYVGQTGVSASQAADYLMNTLWYGMRAAVDGS